MKPLCLRGAMLTHAEARKVSLRENTALVSPKHRGQHAFRWAILAEGFDAKASIAPRFAFVLSCFPLGCAAYNPTPQQGIQMPNKEAPFQKWLLFYEEQFRLNGDNTPMPPSDAPEVAWQAYSAAKNNYTAEKAGKKVDEQAIGAQRVRSHARVCLLG